MSQITFENYGHKANLNISFTEIAGRYLKDKSSERFIVTEIVNKLALSSEDSLLDIGCGAGNMAIPLSFFVNQTVGIDHPNLIQLLHKRFSDPSVRGIAGNFLDIQFSEQFDKILINSVVQALSSIEELYIFIDKALSLLKPNGKLLIADLPNLDKKRRFLASRQGQSFHQEWLKQMEHTHVVSDPVKDPKLLELNDSLIFDLLMYFRKHHFDAYLLPQSAELPFSQTREDILVCKRD